MTILSMDDRNFPFLYKIQPDDLYFVVAQVA